MHLQQIASTITLFLNLSPMYHKDLGCCMFGIYVIFMIFCSHFTFVSYYVLSYMHAVQVNFSCLHGCYSLVGISVVDQWSWTDCIAMKLLVKFVVHFGVAHDNNNLTLKDMKWCIRSAHFNVIHRSQNSESQYLIELW